MRRHINATLFVTVMAAVVLVVTATLIPFGATDSTSPQSGQLLWCLTLLTLTAMAFRAAVSITARRLSTDPVWVFRLVLPFWHAMYRLGLALAHAALFIWALSEPMLPGYAAFIAVPFGAVSLAGAWHCYREHRGLR